MNMNRIFAPVTMKSLSRMLDEREAQRLRREEEKRLKEGSKNKRGDHDHRGDERQNQGRMNNFGSPTSMFNRR